NIAFGQGIATTPLQLAAAFSVLANRGIKLTPRLILSDTKNLGKQVFSTTTTHAITQMLVAATSPDGTGHRAVPAGYHVAGKTGTAQKANKQGSYSKDKFTAVFAGFAPAEDPVIVIVVVIDEPQKSIYGGVVAAPIFRNIAATTLPYLGSLPEMQASTDWQVQQISTTPNTAPTSGMTPHLIGLSLRQAFQQTEQQNYALRSHGSGWVIRQSPHPLTALSPGSDIEVWLHE
ncbi:MAG: penicillin-binding transpeptidase domain-containing protein, partial [Mariprofundaceae bacterium]|nr:penicillin-binding transpeptidase domain-containing protein [Mariprofundaceae bacterium]